MFILKCALKLVLKIPYTMMHGRRNIKRIVISLSENVNYLTTFIIVLNMEILKTMENC